MKSTSLKLLAVALAILCGQASLWSQAEPKKDARLLIFGNSFSGNSTKHLTALAKEGGKNLYFLNLIKGGCSLQQHAGAIKAALTAPESTEAKFYSPGGTAKEKFPNVKRINAIEGIDAGPWDYVSIQQYSLISYKPETYEPYAKELIDFIRSESPDAKIVVHETWAYRKDDPLFKDGTFTPEKMHEGVKTSYEKLADAYDLQFLPIGDAFFAASKTPEWTYVQDPNFDFKNPQKGTLPKQPGSLYVGWIWKKILANTATPDAAPTSEANAAKDAPTKFVLDAHHANTAGEYLGSCVWYEFLFNDDVTKLTNYVPAGLSPEQAASLRKIAHETMAAQRKADLAAR
jgi:hypothetical protein